MITWNKGGTYHLRSCAEIQPRRLQLPRLLHSAKHSGHHERIEFVAIRIAEIGSVEAFGALPWRTLILSTQPDGKLVEPIDMRLVFGFQSHHDAIAHRGWFTVKGRCESNTRAASGRAPRATPISLAIAS
jgi:hypothetical protein